MNNLRLGHHYNIIGILTGFLEVVEMFYKYFILKEKNLSISQHPNILKTVQQSRRQSNLNFGCFLSKSSINYNGEIFEKSQGFEGKYEAKFELLLLNHSGKSSRILREISENSRRIPGEFQENSRRKFSSTLKSSFSKTTQPFLLKFKHRGDASLNFRPNCCLKIYFCDLSSEKYVFQALMQNIQS